MSSSYLMKPSGAAAGAGVSGVMQFLLRAPSCCEHFTLTTNGSGQLSTAAGMLLMAAGRMLARCDARRSGFAPERT
jgi:hypothetical protein